MGEKLHPTLRRAYWFWLVLIATFCVMPSTATASSNLVSQTDAQLGQLSVHYDTVAQRAGIELLQADGDRESVTVQRDVALAALSQWLTQAYKSGSGTSSTAVKLLLGNGISNAGDGLKLLRSIGAHQASIVKTLDETEAQLEMGELRRIQLIKQMSDAQANLKAVQAEQERRTSIRNEKQKARELVLQERAEKAAKAMNAAAPSGTLVAFNGANFSGAVSPQVLDAYLASKGSPMTGQGMAFVQSGMRWSVDPRLLVAIAGAESNFGQQTCGPNNAWGWSCPNSPADFGTWAEGIDTVTQGLREYYLDEGRTSVSLIQQKYCPVGAANDPTGLNSHWQANVTKFLLELGGNPFSVGPGPIGAAIAPDIGGLGMLGD